jgi:hypothetical protein
MIAAASSALAQQIATVQLVTVAGSGCKKDDFAVAVDDTKTAFTVSYNNYQATAGQGAGAFNWRVNCVLTVKVVVPNGITFGIAGIDMRGYTHLEANAAGWAQVGAHFQGFSGNLFVNHSVRSSLRGDDDLPLPPVPTTQVADSNWQTSDSTPWGSIVWNLCSDNRDLVVNTQLKITQPDGIHLVPSTDPSSLLTEDTTDGNIKTLFHLAFQPCP